MIDAIKKFYTEYKIYLFLFILVLPVSTIYSYIDSIWENHYYFNDIQGIGIYENTECILYLGEPKKDVLMKILDETINAKIIVFQSGTPIEQMIKTNKDQMKPQYVYFDYVGDEQEMYSHVLVAHVLFPRAVLIGTNWKERSGVITLFAEKNRFKLLHGEKRWVMIKNKAGSKER